MPEVIDIVKDWLEKNGYDGLFTADGECACENKELAPCTQMGENCQAGYKVEGKDASARGYDFLIVGNKPSEASAEDAQGEEGE